MSDVRRPKPPPVSQYGGWGVDDATHKAAKIARDRRKKRMPAGIVPTRPPHGRKRAAFLLTSLGFGVGDFNLLNW